MAEGAAENVNVSVSPNSYPPELIPVEVAKREAEIAKLKAETRKAMAEAEKLEHEASVASRMSTGARIAEDRELEKRQREKLADDELRVYRFSSGVNDASVDKAMAALAVWRRIDDEAGRGDREYRFVINSRGGEIMPGFGLYDYLRSLSASGHRIVTETHSICASMATLIFQAGDERLIAPGTSFLIHTAQFMAVGAMGEVEDTVEWVKRLQDRIFEILAHRSTLSKAQIAKKAERRDWTMLGAETVKLGFADALLLG